MGIRIHKVMGYGLRYCQFDKDPRFNDWVFENSSDDIHNNPVNDILIEEYRKNKIDPNNIRDDSFDLQWLTNDGWFKNKSIPKLYVHDFIKYNEFSMEKGVGPIVFAAPINENWYRYDDTMDYYDCPNQEDYIKLIPDGIYPLNACYVDRRNGKGVVGVGGSIEVYKRCHDLLPEELKTKFNCKTYNEFCLNIVPKIPSIIVNFCNIFKVFKNPMNVYRLKPMILTYWC